MYVVDQGQLPFRRIARELEGANHGGIGISLLLIEAAPGSGPGLHRHEYEEVFVVQEGEATFFAGDEERVVAAGQIVASWPGTS